MFDFDVADESKVRVTEIDNGNKITATLDDQYGFWTLKLNKGALPAEFKGSYTTHEQVDLAIKRYLLSRSLALADVNAPPRPVLETKTKV